LGGLGRSPQVPAQRPKRELVTDKVAKPEDIREPSAPGR